MCGIAGFVDFKNKSSSDILKKMTDSIRHRGPDGEGGEVLLNGAAQVGLGHRRLSIIDLSTAASQPMAYDGLHIIFNGEVYNYSEIREQLVAKGHSFKTHSDTEVILHAVREWGLEAVGQWRGMFSIILYDEKSGELTCLRDRAGVKPLYYYWHDDLFIFASELKAIMAHPAFTKQINPAAVAAFLQYGNVPNPHAIFYHTYKVQPGHYLRLDTARKTLTETQYWNIYDYYNRPKLSVSLPEAIEETERLLVESFKYRMVADVPVGVFLSGGFDSACVAALLQHHSTERIKTFTIGSDDKKHNEAHYAKEIAAYLGTDHSEHYCTPEEALKIIPELPYYYDEPFADSSAIPTILVSRLARQKVTVALSADAGDETFAGYNRYDYLLRYSKQLAVVPKPVRQAVAGIMDKVPSNRIPYLRNTYNFHSRYYKLKGFLRDVTPAQLMKSSVQAFTDYEIGSLMAGDYVPLRTKLDSKELQSAYYDPLSYMLAVDYQTYMNDDVLQKVDRATMSISLEGREPLLDQNIIEWAAQLPSDYKYRNGTKKHLLKEVVYRHLPKEMMDRPKMGFGIPIEHWLANELKDLVETYLSDEQLSAHGLFNPVAVRQVKDQFYAGAFQLHQKIWFLLMFQMWYRQWMGTPANANQNPN